MKNKMQVQYLQELDTQTRLKKNKTKTKQTVFSFLFALSMINY